MAGTNTAQGTLTSTAFDVAKRITKLGSVKTNLPSDNLGFWLTQGVPLGLVLAHIILKMAGERGDVGLCFVPSTRENPLDQFQIQYITEFCVYQASGHKCFDDDDDALTAECKFSSLCDRNTTVSTDKDSKNTFNFFDSLFVYRNYVWFLFIFAFFRAVPQIVWKLFLTADITLALAGITTFAESQYYGERQQDADSSDEIRKNLERIKMFQYLNEAKRKKQRRLYIFALYVTHKLFEIMTDVVVIALIITFLAKSKPFKKFVFVCDLHNDRDNIFLCDVLQKRFISCTMLFGFQSRMTLALQLSGFIVDLFVQGISCVLQCISYLLFLKEKKKKRDDSTGRGNSNGVTNIYSLSDIFLISQLQKQTKDSQDDYIKIMMVEKMMDEVVKSTESDKEDGGSDPNEEPSPPNDPSENGTLLHGDNGSQGNIKNIERDTRL